MPDAARLKLPSARHCVCIPVRNERERIATLLDALEQQDLAGAITVMLLVNNTTDDTLRQIERYRGQAGSRLRLAVETIDFADDDAHAGSARKAAMDAGVRLLEGCGDAVLLSTDADARPPANWVSGNLRAIASGLDMVGGRLVIDEREPLPTRVQALRALWDDYWEQVRAIEDRIDPVPWDMPPRHGDHTGGSLAITVDCYRRAGGIPPIGSGEDRALVNAAIGVGARLGHPLDVWTRVSPRIDGRAAGGMAEAVEQLTGAAHRGDPVFAPSFDRWEQRAVWRRRLREAGQGKRIPALEAELPPMPADMELTMVAA